MTEQNESIQMKYCSKCEQVKPLEVGFYKAGISWQKYCIPCHNKKRCEYKHTYKYQKVPKGFQKLPEDIREKILYDISVRINYKDIANKYNLNYQTLCIWKRKGLIV
jgi:hypothetical protein